MKTTTEQVVLYAGNKFGEDISTEIRTRAEVIIPEVEIPEEVQKKHELFIAKENQQLIRSKAANLKAIEAIKQALEKPDADPMLGVKIADLENAVDQIDHQLQNPKPLVLHGTDKIMFEGLNKTYHSRVANLEMNRGKVFNVILGQCTQVLKDQMKHDSKYNAVIANNNPLDLLSLIERTILAQSDDQYPYMTVYDQERQLFSFHQNNLSNDQYYEKFNTKCDVAKAVGVTKVHRACMEHTAMDVYKNKFEELDENEKADVVEKSEERYLTYLFITHSSSVNDRLKNSLRDDYAKGQDNYPKTMQEALHLLEKFTKTTPTLQVGSEGRTFAQQGQATPTRGGGYDRSYWKDKTCNNCGAAGHPSWACTSPKPGKDKKKDKKQPKKDKGDDASKSSSRSKSSSKNIKKLTKTFATLSDKLEQLVEQSEDESDLTDSSGEGTSFFTFHTELAGVGDQALVPQSAFFTKKTKTKRNKSNPQPVDLRNVILLDNQSTCSLFCNDEYLTDIQEAEQPLSVKSNGGHMLARYTGRLRGLGKIVWYDPKAITNILDMKSVRHHYHIEYDCEAGKYSIIRDGLPNIDFIMTDEGLHVHSPKDGFSFLNTVSENKEGFSKRQLKGASRARELYGRLAYPSVKDFRWAVMSNQIANCPVTAEDIDIAQQVWGKDISALKGKTTRSKPVPVKGNAMRIPRQFLQRHKHVLLTADIFLLTKFHFW